MLINNIVMLTLVNRLGVEPETVTVESSVRGDLGAGKIDTLNICMDLEEIFGIEIPQRLMGMKVEAIVGYIEAHTQLAQKRTA